MGVDWAFASALLITAVALLWWQQCEWGREIWWWQISESRDCD